MSNAYATATSIQRLEASLSRIKPTRRVKEKLTWRQRLRNWFNKDLEDKDFPEIALQADTPGELSSEGMRFQLYRASGGYVVEFRSYDSKADRHNYHLYIIHKDKDIGHELGKIITMESLR
jgi:hypothetical protein